MGQVCSLQNPTWTGQILIPNLYDSWHFRMCLQRGFFLVIIQLLMISDLTENICNPKPDRIGVWGGGAGWAKLSMERVRFGSTLTGTHPDPNRLYGNLGRNRSGSGSDPSRANPARTAYLKTLTRTQSGWDRVNPGSTRTRFHA